MIKKSLGQGSNYSKIVSYFCDDLWFMKLLLKNAILLDEKSPFHNQTKDVLIEKGILTQIEDHIEVDVDKVINLKNLHLSSGWFDPNVSFGEPGYEDRETLKNGLKTAAKSGFTHIVLNPNTIPVIGTHSDVSHLLKSHKDQPTALHISAVLSEGGKGNKMASLLDLHKAGAVAFGDYKTAYNNPNLLRISLDYAQSFKGLIQAYPMDKSLSNNGQMHEGIVSTTLGLKGIPVVAETSILARDLQLLEYTQGKLHIPFISSASSLELVRAAKKKGLNVSCGVGIPHLLFTDENLMNFNSNYKIFPPLRSASDQRALREGLLDGTIDMLSCMHQPINTELKDLDFISAHEGSIGLEAAFGVLQNHFPLEKVITFLTRGKKRFGIEEAGFIIGTQADFSLFTPKGAEIFTNENIHSTSKNCMFIGSPFQGSVYGCIRGTEFHLNTL
ncbi:MAG: dihydroorotase [Flavobacteriaceae bacterium]